MSESKIEEVISALWFICAFTALGAGCPKWVFIPLFIKGGLDAFVAIKYARSELLKEKGLNNG